MELNREIVENFADRIVVHEGGEIEIGTCYLVMGTVRTC